MNKIGNLIWGVVLIAVGIVFGVNALGIADINIFFDGWWTLFIIIPCFIGIFKDQDKTGSIIGVLIGIGLLLGCLDIVDFEIVWKLMIPVVLVMVGISIIFKDAINSKVKTEIKKLNKNGLKEYSATFAGQTLDFTNEEFDGCNLNAIFGGVECDVRKAIIKEQTVINTSAIFGGITIYTPEDVNVKIVSTPIFGGVSNERKEKNNSENEKTIYINATCMFGGVEVK